MHGHRLFTSNWKHAFCVNGLKNANVGCGKLNMKQTLVMNVLCFSRGMKNCCGRTEISAIWDHECRDKRWIMQVDGMMWKHACPSFWIHSVDPAFLCEVSDKTFQDVTWQPPCWGDVGSFTVIPSALILTTMLLFPVSTLYASLSHSVSFLDLPQDLLLAK